MKNQKNSTLELLKLFASYMVVFIHVIFPGKIGTTIETLARFAVPFFFLISGFYSYGIPHQKIIKRIKKILSLILIAAILYTLFNILLRLLNGNINSISAYFSQYADLLTLVKLFVFNVSICSEYLWYLYAIFYVYIIYYFVTVSHLNDKVIFVISITVLFVHILLGNVMPILGVILPDLIVRNFAMMGIPFFTLGLFARKYQQNFHNIANYMIVLSLIIGISISVLSRCFFGKKELYIGSLFILFAFVCIFIKYPAIKYPSFLLALEGCSTYIYIFHDMISKFLRTIYTAFGIKTNSSVVLSNLHPIIVCLSATLFSYLLIKTQKHLQKYKTNKHLQKV